MLWKRGGEAQPRICREIEAMSRGDFEVEMDLLVCLRPGGRKRQILKGRTVLRSGCGIESTKSEGVVVKVYEVVADKIIKNFLVGDSKGEAGGRELLNLKLTSGAPMQTWSSADINLSLSMKGDTGTDTSSRRCGSPSPGETRTPTERQIWSS